MTTKTKTLDMIYALSEKEKQIIQNAYDCQNACNLSGIINSWQRDIAILWTIAREVQQGTNWVNNHPANILYADKVSHLTNTQNFSSDIVYQAYQFAYRQLNIS